jgi:hypothetical protein
MDYSYIREKITKEISVTSELSILLSQDGFSFYISPKDKPDNPLFFFSRQTDHKDYNSLLNEIQGFKDFEQFNFERSIAVFHTESFSVIPDEFYHPEYHDEYLFLTRPKNEKAVSLVSRISELNLHVLFEMPLNLYEFLNSSYPGIRFIHSACPSLHFGSQKSDPACIICHFGSSISVTILRNKELKFYNIFPVRNENDLVYFLSNALRSCDMLDKDTKLYFVGAKDADSPDFLLIKRYISKPVTYQFFLEGISDYPFPVNMIFNHLEGLLCAS